MLARLRSVWRNLVHRDRVDDDLDAEVRAVFDLLVDEKTKAGLSLEQARRAATIELGREASITQQVREGRAGASIDMIAKDIRYGVRMLRANPGFTIVVVLSLAAGIGANSAMFSVANAVVFRTLPVPEAHELYMVRYESRLPLAPRMSYRFFEKLRAGLPRPDGLAAMSRVIGMRVSFGSEEPQSARGQLVSGEYFDVLRLQPQLGRFLTPDDNRQPGMHPVAVVSDAFWRQRLNTAPDAIGRDVTFNGTRFTIVGVAPPGFSGVWLESPVDAWLPVMMQFDIKYVQNVSSSGADVDMLKPWIPQDGVRWLELILRADRADGQEVAAMNAVFRPIRLAEVDQIADPQERKLALDRSIALTPFANGVSTLRSQFQTPLFALMAMVGLLLLIACANTANLLLARATSRQREMAVRLSIGASRGRVIGQLLIESLLLGALAAIVGLAIAPLASELLVRMTMGVTGPLPFSVGVDSRVLGFTAIITILTSILFGFAPAWRATDLSLASALKTSGRGTHAGARMNLSKMLVVAQVALSLLLAVGAGLFLRSFGKLTSLPLGYEQHVLWASIGPSVGGYQQRELPALYQRIIERVEALPGVESATVAMCGLMTGCRSSADGLVITGYQAQPGEQVLFQENRLGPRYFHTVGMRMVAGRDFESREVGSKAPQIAIINEAAARKYFKDRNPIGERFGYETADIEIVGVVGDARVNTVREAATPMAFYPFDDSPPFVGTMHVRASGDPVATAEAVRKALRDVEPKLPVSRVVPLAELASDTLRQDRLIARLATVLGVLALALACLGLYGLMSYAVKQRTAELGIRFALGAPRPRVLWMVFRESLLLMTIGVAIGVPLIIGASRLISSLLFEVDPSDPAIVAGGMIVLFVVGAASSYLPAWRASRVDPLTALRTE